MDGSSEGEKKPPAGENKIKRKMKTASQLEILERAYAEETYPTEALRVELSAKLGLSDRQLQMWFCHRRLKDRKAPSVKRPRKFSSEVAGDAVVTPVGESGEEMAPGNLGNEDPSGLGMGSNSYAYRLDMQRAVKRPGVAIARIGVNLPSMKRFHESQQSLAELRAMAFVEVQLGEPLREDGPILGMEFDPLPPGAFGAQIGAATISNGKQSGQFSEVNAYKQCDADQVERHLFSRRTLHEYKFLPEQPTMKTDRYERNVPSYPDGHSILLGENQVSSRYCSQGQMPDLNIFAHQSKQGHLFSSTPGENENHLCKNYLVNIAMDPQCGAHPNTLLEYASMPSDQRFIHGNNALWIEKKNKNDEARIAREVEAHEKRIRKELEKQDVLRRKREEQIRKEMERHERERRREEERLLREKQKEEERYLREQRREMLRREKFLQKESIRAERSRQKEALRREKEAARLKVANQRAIARRMAKVSMELVEDERLELMELAVSSKGLPSIMSLNHETLQNLELFEDMRPTFPPKSVCMKRIFSNQPWADSEENVGNLLMVWKFLVTFADVLGLWPFTLDEFVQAFHDYDSRLLGEVHVALLKCIIKDIEDVARKPSTGPGVNQNSAANPGGAHPQIVEGASAWGFDICSWQHHLNPLTWPEILRQFALSAGFGPQLMKGNVEPAYLRDENEGNDVEDIISNLRNGLAAENAVIIMQERGFYNPRRSRHCLTPGTVKFAAYHVLSLEGSKGLTIAEAADKIQKSGLRDLTTSRTPEASIAAALSRDSKLFERTAPSTYCVRSPYRKDPADAAAILSTARERIHIFKNGFLDGEDAERDDSVADIAEYPDVEDFGTETNSEKEYQRSEEVPSDEMTPVAIGKETNEDTDRPKVVYENGGLHMYMTDFESRVKEEKNPLTIDQSIYISGICSSLDQENSFPDEGCEGEPWVQGLAEGEYSDLSVEERLNALCSLIGAALEGNLIRTILEERLEAANTLRKQMLAEAQLDKRRMREEYVMQINESLNVENRPGCKVNPSMEERQSPILNVGDRNSEGPLDPVFQPEHCINSLNNNYLLIDFPSEGSLLVQDVPVGQDNLHCQPSGLAVEKSRSQLKSYIGYKAEEIFVYRSLPLGQDRRHNRYWQFSSSPSRNERGNARIFVELHNGSWRLIDSAEGFDALLASLDVRGIRESHLHAMLQKVEASFKAAVRGNILQDGETKGENSGKTNFREGSSDPDCSGHTNSHDSDVLESSTSFGIELGGISTDKNESLKRYQDFERWMWGECSTSILSADKYGKKRGKQLLNICGRCQCIFSLNNNHCHSCHQTLSIPDLNFSEHMAQCKENTNVLRCSPSSPLRIRLLKMLLSMIEVSIPIEALQPSWTDCYRRSWGSKLHSSSSAEDLLQTLTLLEKGIRRDFLWSNYATAGELCAHNPPGTSISNSSPPKTVPALPWMPLTTGAVALRLLELDASISYILQPKAESQDQGLRDVNLLSNFVAAKNHHDFGTALSNIYVEGANWPDCRFGLCSSDGGLVERRGHVRTRGGRSMKKTNGSRIASGKRDPGTDRGIGRQVLRQNGQAHERGFRRGRRSVRSRQKTAMKIKFSCERGRPEEPIHVKSSFDNDQQLNGGLYTVEPEEGGNESASSSDRLVCIDDNGGVEYGDAMVDACAHQTLRSDYMLASGGYNVYDEDIDDIYDDEEKKGDTLDNEQRDPDVEVCINGDFGEESNKNLENNMVLDEEVECALDYGD